MNFLAFSLLLLLSTIFYMFWVSFKSFSRIALAGFLDDFNNDKIKKFDFVGKHEMMLNALRAFFFCLQLSLFVYSFILLKKAIPEPIYRIVLLIIVFLVFFNFLLYSIAYFNKEFILKKLIFLYRIPWLFFYPANLVFSLFIDKNSNHKEIEQDDLSDKELEIFFEESTREGVLEKEDKEMIESVIEFGDTRVKEIMTPRVDMIYVNIDVGLDELITIINRKKKSRYPVMSDRIDNIEGIILSKDIFHFLNNGEFSVKKILRPAFFIPETMRIIELLKEMQQSRQKFAIVVDEFGGVSGVVTMEDIMEEIVGEIQDEYDEDTEQIVREKDYLVVKGDTDIFELEETLHIKIEGDEDYQTVAGFISFKLGKIPDKFDKVTIGDYTLEVLEMHKNRVKKVKIYHENNQ